MRKIPENVPDPAFLAPHLHKPLTVVPNRSAAIMPASGITTMRCCGASSIRSASIRVRQRHGLLQGGRFDAVLLRAAEKKYDEIMAVMLPTLGAERQATYSPFLPISPSTGRVLYVPMKSVDAAKGTITFADEDGTEVTLPVTGGHVKLQWKPDFGMRWAALDVDFEMFGKDHQSNQSIYDRICAILGGVPPEHYVYELFLDDQGRKISKSKGNGLTIDEWLTYASPESLALFMFNRPREAKKLYFDVIPRAVDDYLQFLGGYARQDAKSRLGNPAFHIHAACRPNPRQSAKVAGSHLRPAAQPRCRCQCRGSGGALGASSGAMHPVFRRKPIPGSMPMHTMPCAISGIS